MKPTIEDFEARSRSTATRDTKDRVHARALYFAKLHEIGYQAGLDRAFAECLDDYRPLPCVKHLREEDRPEVARRAHLRTGLSTVRIWQRISSTGIPEDWAGSEGRCVQCAAIRRADADVVAKLRAFEERMNRDRIARHAAAAINELAECAAPVRKKPTRSRREENKVVVKLQRWYDDHNDEPEAA